LGQVAIFVTWDDWGGWFDHVKQPPVVEKWDSSHAQRPPDAFPEFNGQLFRYGSRVPCLVLGPYAKGAHISHQLNSHVSLLKFCETTFGLEPLTERDKSFNGQIVLILRSHLWHHRSFSVIQRSSSAMPSEQAGNRRIKDALGPRC
jgi:phosphoesterase family protein